MTLESIFFYLMAAFILFSAYFVVTARNLFRCAIGLTAVLIGVAGIYLLMDAQFLSAVQVAVYVGGVVVLVVFAVLMVSDVTQKEYLRSPFSRSVAAAIIAELLLMIVAAAAVVQGFGGARPAPASAPVREIGHALLATGPGGFALPFEVISLVLIAALVGACTVAGERDDGEGEGRR
jgi:NADH-quinone oxidoreductase subunit J